MSIRYNINTIWLAMLVLTLSTYIMGKLDFNGINVTFILLLTVITKAYFIINDYMELRGVSLIWRVIIYGWLWGICISIAITYIVSL